MIILDDDFDDDDLEDDCLSFLSRPTTLVISVISISSVVVLDKCPSQIVLEQTLERKRMLIELINYIKFRKYKRLLHR